MAFPFRTLLAAGALMASAGAAFAATGTAISALNVREGPGPNYRVIDTMPPGETVNLVDDCPNGWCEIGMGTMGTGFVSESYLDIRGGGYARRTVIEEDVGPPVGISIGGYWGDRPYYYDDGFYFYGGRWYGVRPGRPGWERSWNREHRWRGPREAHGGWNGPGRPGWDGPGRPPRPGFDGPGRPPRPGFDGPGRPDRDRGEGPRRPDGGQRANLDNDRPAQPDRIKPMERAPDPARVERMERGGGQANAGPSRMERMDGGNRGDGGGRPSGGGGDRGPGGGDRGDKIGLDKAR